MANPIQSPYPVFFDLDGTPLEGGYVYIGAAGLNPLSNPQQAYWDPALTIPAVNVRTSGGYILYNGAPGKLYVLSDYSILVTDKNGSVVWSKLASTLDSADQFLTFPRGTLTRAMRTPLSFNINSIIESGFYSWSNAGTLNYPAACAAADLYALEVMASPDGSGLVLQRIYDMTNNPTLTNFLFIRQSVDGGSTWTAWEIPTGINRLLNPVVVTGNVTLKVNALHIVDPTGFPGAVELSLPSTAVPGDVIGIKCLKPAKLRSVNAEHVVSWFRSLFTTKGATGSMKLLANEEAKLIYKGTGFALGVPTKISDPADLPPGTSTAGVVWSADGRYMFVSSNASPYCIIYDWQSGAPVKAADPATPPVGMGVSGNMCSWSPDGRYSVVSMGNISPYFHIYDWSTGVPVKLANPGTLPGGVTNGSAWSKDSKYLAITSNITPFVLFYDLSSGVAVKISDPATIPPAAGQSVAWSPDNKMVAVGHTSTPFVTVYEWYGGVPFKLTNPVTLPVNTCIGIAWSPDGRYLAMGQGGAPYIIIYDYQSGAPVKVRDPATLPPNNPYSLEWSPDGRYLAVAHSGAPYITIYDWVLGYPVKLTNPATLPAASALQAAWSPDGRYLAVNSTSTPFIIVYDFFQSANEEWEIEIAYQGINKGLPGKTIAFGARFT